MKQEMYLEIRRKPLLVGYVYYLDLLLKRIGDNEI